VRQAFFKEIVKTFGKAIIKGGGDDFFRGSFHVGPSQGGESAQFPGSKAEHQDPEQG
jgi:hypothetical protein